MTTPSDTVRAVQSAVSGRRFRYDSEITLHAGLLLAMNEAGIRPECEARVVGGRIDFIVDRLGIEVKIKGSASALQRQIGGYAADPRFDEFLVITTRPAHAALPASIGGKPIYLLPIGGLSL